MSKLYGAGVPRKVIYYASSGLILSEPRDQPILTAAERERLAELRACASASLAAEQEQRAWASVEDMESAADEVWAQKRWDAEHQAELTARHFGGPLEPRFVVMSPDGLAEIGYFQDGHGG